MALFDRYLMVDWSAAGAPTRGKNSIWTCLASRKADEIALVETLNFATRSEVMSYIERLTDAAIATGEKLLAGFDFAFGYPEGAASRMAGNASWSDLWDFIEARIEDGDDNANNRFEAAGRINAEAFADGPLFWGMPGSRAIDGLTEKKPPRRQDGLGGKRIAEARAPGAQSVWQIYYNGSVGGQALTGIARLAGFRKNPRLSDHVRVWPFETGFGMPTPTACTLVEIYPSLFRKEMKSDEIPDRAQVQHVARKFAALDLKDQLRELLGRPHGLSDADVMAVIQEEGWILGLGHERLDKTIRRPSA